MSLNSAETPNSDFETLDAALNGRRFAKAPTSRGMARIYKSADGKLVSIDIEGTDGVTTEFSVYPDKQENFGARKRGAPISEQNLTPQFALFEVLPEIENNIQDL